MGPESGATHDKPGDCGLWVIVASPWISGLLTAADCLNLHHCSDQRCTSFQNSAAGLPLIVISVWIVRRISA